MAQVKLILVRHGESAWNQENRFCGWYDADLAATGVDEAKNAGKMLKDKGIIPEKAYTSVLKRAIKTLFYIQDTMDLHWIPVVRDYRLNERMYGGLTGMDKSETAAKHGEEQVKIWRRSYDVPPPPVDEKSQYNPANDPKYKGIPKTAIPKTECLKDTVARVTPFFNSTIAPDIKQGKTVIIAAHGNTVRALIKFLDNITDKDIMEVNVPTGIPLIYELDKATLKPIKHYYTASDEEVKAAIEKVANQGKKK